MDYGCVVITELYYGGDSVSSSEQPQSYTCPYCGNMGFSEVTLSEHVAVQHSDSSSEVVSNMYWILRALKVIILSMPIVLYYGHWKYNTTCIESMIFYTAAVYFGLVIPISVITFYCNVQALQWLKLSLVKKELRSPMWKLTLESNVIERIQIDGVP